MINILTIINLFATFFFVGKAKKCPGTVGSLFSFVLLPIFFFSDFLFYSLLMLITIFGTYCADYYSKYIRVSDPKEVVIDEVLGQMISFIFIYYINRYANIDNIYLDIIISFILFRFFDILKPFPINIVDGKMKGGIAIMLDDVLAAFYVGLLYLIIMFCYLLYFVD